MLMLVSMYTVIMTIVPMFIRGQVIALRGDGRLFTGTLSVQDEATIQAGLAFPEFTVTNGLFIRKGGLDVSPLLLHALFPSSLCNAMLV
jgi:hypothetical protein